MGHMGIPSITGLVGGQKQGTGQQYWRPGKGGRDRLCARKDLVSGSLCIGCFYVVVEVYLEGMGELGVTISS